MVYADFDMKKYSLILLFSSIIIGISFSTSIYGQNDISKTISKNTNPIVYHLTSNDPWRASIVISDVTNLKNLGYNVLFFLA
jgi:hypothetical protein